MTFGTLLIAMLLKKGQSLLQRNPGEVNIVSVAVIWAMLVSLDPKVWHGARRDSDPSICCPAD